MAECDLPGADELRNILDYDPEQGTFVWRKRPRDQFPNDRICNSWNARFAGSPAGSVHKASGYLTIRINKTNVRAHRLAYFLCFGFWPEAVDHVNGLKLDNRISNLRTATQADNTRNRLKGSNNTTGFKGVTWCKQIGKFKAQLGGKNKHLGTFDTAEEASKAYEAAAKQRFGRFYRPPSDT